MDALRAQWDRLGLPATIFAELERGYSEPARHYHNLDHLSQVLAIIDRLEQRADDANAVRLAAWFHDAVYDSRAHDNEERSAELAGRLLAGLDPQRVAHIQDLILRTKTHQADNNRDAAVLLDADLAILGASPEAYARYAQAILQEYAWVPEEAYQEGRKNVLARFLQRERIYHADELASLEAQARRNLADEMEACRASDGR